MLNWTDLITDEITAEEFEAWISPWSGYVTGRLSPILVNKFGSWFFRRPEGHIEYFDVLEGSLTRTHATHDDFVREVNQQWWQEIYLHSEIVFRLHECGKVPSAGQCYACPHPAAGGAHPIQDEFDIRFVSIMDIPLWQSMCAQFLAGGNSNEHR